MGSAGEGVFDRVGGIAVGAGGRGLWRGGESDGR